MGRKIEGKMLCTYWLPYLAAYLQQPEAHTILFHSLRSCSTSLAPPTVSSAPVRSLTKTFSQSWSSQWSPPVLPHISAPSALLDPLLSSILSTYTSYFILTFLSRRLTCGCLCLVLIFLFLITLSLLMFSILLSNLLSNASRLSSSVIVSVNVDASYSRNGITTTANIPIFVFKLLCPCQQLACLHNACLSLLNVVILSPVWRNYSPETENSPSILDLVLIQQ